MLKIAKIIHIRFNPQFKYMNFMYDILRAYHRPKKRQLQVGLIAQLAEHFAGIAEVALRVPIQEWIFLAFLALTD